MAGINRGDRVAIVIDNGPQFLRILLALTALGAAAAPLNPAYSESEFSFYLEDLAPRAVLAPLGEASRARAAAQGRAEVLDVDDQTFLRGRPAAFEPADPNDIALVLHTSGTTSRPKQVPLLHRNLVASAEGIADFYALTSADVALCAMPLYHVHGLVASILASLAAGSAAIVPTRFAPRRAWQYAKTQGATWISAGPTTHQLLLDKQDGSPLPTLRFVRSCSSALPPELHRRAEEAYGAPVLEAYGMTEASHQMSSNPLPPASRRVGTVGIPSRGVGVRVVDAQGKDRKVGESGEVAVRGPGVTPGYLNNEEANQSSFFDGAWFRTGDTGSIDHDGYLTLIGRIKELIIRGGENISPYEIEAALLTHPSVIDAAAFGIPDTTYGEVVGAAVSLSDQSEEGVLRAWCADQLSPFKIPTRIFILPAIPRTPTGKLQRKRIATDLIGES